MAITQRELARRLGLSHQAVSFALNGGCGQVSQETCRRVRELAAELNYRPNSAARATASGRFRSIALILSTTPWRSSLPGELLCGIIDAAADRLHQVSVARLPDADLTDPQQLPRILCERSADGMLLHYTHEVPGGLQSHLDELGLPTVWVNRKLRRDCVHPDDLGGGELAARHLLGLGHRDVAYACFAGDDGHNHYSIADRREGCLRALRAGGARASVWQPERPLPTARNAEQARRWLTQTPRPTAAICYGAVEASAVLLAAAEAGLSVPRDLSVMYFTAHAHHVVAGGADVTAAMLPEYEVGRQAVALLARRIEGLDESSPAVAVPLTVQPGATCSRPPQAGMG